MTPSSSGSQPRRSETPLPFARCCKSWLERFPIARWRFAPLLPVSTANALRGWSRSSRTVRGPRTTFSVKSPAFERARRFTPSVHVSAFSAAQSETRPGFRGGSFAMATCAPTLVAFSRRSDGFRPTPSLATGSCASRERSYTGGRSPSRSTAGASGALPGVSSPPPAVLTEPPCSVPRSPSGRAKARVDPGSVLSDRRRALRDLELDAPRVPASPIRLSGRPLARSVRGAQRRGGGS